jgi:hypothetical protein
MLKLLPYMKGNIFWIILFVAALLVPFFIGQAIDGELFTLNLELKEFWKFGVRECRLC